MIRYKITFIAVFSSLAFVNQIYAQSTPVHEIGIRLTGLEDFDFVYKKEKQLNQFFRHRLGLVDLQASGNSNTTLWSFGLGYAFGIENRKSINDKLKFIHGFEPRMALNYSSFEGRTQNWAFQVGVGYVLGFQYDFAQAFYVNIEAIPAVTYTRNQNSQDGIPENNFKAGFSSNAVALTLAYRFD